MWYQIEETEKYDITVKKNLKVYDYFKNKQALSFSSFIKFLFSVFNFYKLNSKIFVIKISINM